MKEPWNPTGYRAPHRDHLLNRSKWNSSKQFPCWCGESLVPRYRMLVDCCVDYLGIVGPHVYLDLEEQEEHDMTLEEIKARCEWLIERRQGDTPIWTSDQMFAVISEYYRVWDDLARVRTGIS